MVRRLHSLIFVLTIATTGSQAQAFSARFSLRLTDCVSVQGKRMPASDAERIVSDCREFTRRNIGARVLRLSVKEIHDASGSRLTHPLLKAHMAYDSLHDSGLNFDRALPIEQRYWPIKRARGQVFRDMREAPPKKRSSNATLLPNE